MNTNKPKTIRIVKSAERTKREELTLLDKNDKNKKTAQQAAREMMSTVSDWVNEIHQRQQVETKRAIRSLFPETSVVTK